VIALDAVSVRLGGATVVDDVSLEVADREWVTLIGPNGAGKSTLLRAVAGLVHAQGAIRVGGVSTAELSRHQLARRIALVPQIPTTPAAMTVGEYVLLGRTPFVSYVGRESRRDIAAAENALAQLDLTQFAARPLGSLSGGERQRAVLARALAQEASVLLLDEPTSALDLGRQQQALELVASLRVERELTVVSTTHDLTLAGHFSDRIVLLDRGSVVAEGRAADVLSEQQIAAHYGARVRVLRAGDEVYVLPQRAAPA
jgi:iron complex transport system ATP-binding protein